MAVPAFKNVKIPALVTVQISGVSLVKLTASPELEVACKVGLVPKICAPGLLNVIVCELIGVTAFENIEVTPVPTLFVAVTLKTYVVPLVSPVTTIGLAEPMPVNPSGNDETVYPVISAPPSKIGGIKLTVACVSPDVARTATGVPGTTALTVKLRATVVAGKYWLFPG